MTRLREERNEWMDGTSRVPSAGNGSLERKVKVMSAVDTSTQQVKTL